MVAVMRHRGPDDNGVFRDERVALGSTRLAIVDLTAAGHQPMANDDGSVWIAYNGEVFNFQDERALLEREGVRFRSHTDTEVALRLYERHGDDFLLRLRGMFALAIYDRRRPGRERLLLARDHLGIKPLLYAERAGRIVFASELKPLLAGNVVDRVIDPVALRQLLTFGSVVQPRTMLAGVNMLPAGHRLVVENGASRVERYWSLETGRRADLAGRPYDELVEAVTETLEDSVRRQLVADVPLGAFLSGGIDSSFLVALMSRAAGGRVRTFSVGFDAEGAEIDETDEAWFTADFLGTDHTRVVVDGDEVRRKIDDVVRGLDQPSVDGVNSYFVSGAARTGVTVALSGTGGDELFAGYPWFLAMAADERRRGGSPFAAAAKGLIARTARLRSLDAAVARGSWHVERAREAGGFVSRYARFQRIFGPARAARLLASGLRTSAEAGRAPVRDIAALDELRDTPTLDRVAALCLRGYTTNQLLRDIDAVSMSHSLEVRVPYLDVPLVDLALSLPDDAKLDVSATPSAAASYVETGAKRALIDAARPYLPEGFERQPKRGFGMPFEAWLAGPLRDVLEDTLAPDAVARRGLLDPASVGRVRDAFAAGHAPWAEPWLLMVLELWCRDVLDGDGAGSAASHA
jgi:asparagine synthase (glutamine-hydrolysing)